MITAITNASNTITANAALSPTGEMTADRFVRNTTAASYRGSGITKAGSALTYTFSIYAKADAADYFLMRMQGTYPARADICFQFSTGKFYSGGATGGSFVVQSATATEAGGGWWRIALRATTDAATSLACYTSFSTAPRVWVDDSDVVATAAGFLWGAQLELGSLTDYQPIGASFSRNPYADSTAEFPRDVYFVDRKAMETRDYVEFELASALDLAGVMLPRRQIVQNYCPWRYRGAECGYTGTNYFDANDATVGSAGLDVCGKRLASCRKRFGNYGTLPYGGFPASGLVKL